LTLSAIPETKWKWYGSAGHFIGGPECRFHLCTEVGGYLVSTVGEYFPNGRDGHEAKEIGLDRLYETFVFKLKRGHARCDVDDCGCGLPMPDQSLEIDSLPANKAGDATRNHYKLCRKWARRSGSGD
jgi:hypothetical protein